MQILDQHGKPLIGENKLKERFNPTKFIEPSKLERQLTAFRGGELAGLAKMMDWVEEHDDLAPTLAFKAKSSVTRHGYEVLQKKNVRDDQQDLAKAQQEAVERFYENLSVKDITDDDECGGIRLLMNQVMKAFSVRYQMHQIRWIPSSEGLTAELTAVPLWFFENTKGRMRFVGDKGGTSGVELDQLGGETAWMVSKGRGVMLAVIIAWMFKKMPLQDWITYSGRHGMPGFLGKSSSDPSSAEWNNMAEAVYKMAAEFAAVVSNSDDIQVIDMKGSGNVPYPALIERMDRAIATLYRGADLSTMSSTDSIGSSVQQDETDALDEDNAVWISETLNANLTKRFIQYTFGEDSPILVELVVKTKKKKLTPADIKALQDSGLKMKAAWVYSEFEIPQPDEDDEILTPAPVASSQLPIASQNSRRILTPNNLTLKTGLQAMNTTTSETADLLKTSIAEAVGVLPEVFNDLDAFFEAIADVDAEQDPADYLDALDQLVDQLPEFFDPENIEDLVNVLEKAMGAGALQGIRDEIAGTPDVIGQ